MYYAWQMTLLDLRVMWMTLNGHYPYTEKVHSTKYHFTIIFNPPPLFSFYRLIDKGFGILIFILLIACAAAFLLDRYFNKAQRLKRSCDGL